jgi:hypothetical protein
MALPGIASGGTSQDGFFTVEEATARKIAVPDPPEAYPLPPCDVNLDYKGEAPNGDGDFPRIDPAAEPSCAVDPAGGHVAVGWPEPHYGPPPPDGQGYHWVGYSTDHFNFAGSKIVVDVTNPDVDHGTGSPWQFVASRVLTRRENGEWIEVGWIEISSEANDRLVYTYNNGTYYLPPNHPLTDGSSYAFRSVNCTVGGDDRQCVDIWWAGSWERLDNDDGADCRWDTGNAVCAVEEFTEIYTEGNGHPDITSASGNNRIDFYDTELRTDSATWTQWTQDSTASGPYDTGYRTCAINHYYRFYAKRGTC